MKSIVIGVHLRREDIVPVAEPINVGPLWLSSVPIAADQPTSDRALIIAIAGKRAELLERGTFIAVRYGFVVTSEPDAVSRCAAHIDRWRSVLAAFKGMVEMTLKIAAASPRQRPQRKDFSSGAAYMRALHEATSAADVDPLFRDAVESRIAPLTARHRWTHRDNSSLEFVALVKRDAVGAVSTAGSSLKDDFANVPFLLSGPWPIEVFADDDHQ